MLQFCHRASTAAGCLVAFAVLAGCSSAPGGRPTASLPTGGLASLLTQGPAASPRNELARSLDSYAYERTDRTAAVALPGGASQAAPVTETGSGQMIAGMAPRARMAPDGSITLNLAGVPLNQAAKTVLGDMLGVNYVLDPRVDGAISLQTTQPVSRSQALEMFQSALAPIGAALVENRGIYRIVPNDQSATGTLTTGRNEPSSVGGNGTRVVQLRYVSATEVARVLEPMVPKGAIVQADDARNILALKGSPAEIENMLDSISIFDVDVMRGMSFAVVPVKSPQPDKLAEELKAVFATDKEGPLKGRVKFVANTRLGAILVIASNQSYLARAQSWIRRLDAKASGSEPQLHVYQVQNRPAAELAGLLQSMFADEIKVIRPRNVAPKSQQQTLSSSSSNSSMGANRSQQPFGSTPDVRNTASPMAGGAGGGSSDLARMINNDPEPLPDVAPTPSSSGGGREPTMKIVADDTKNSLLIMANDRDYQRILRVVQNLDVVPSQVLIEAMIAEVTLNDKLQYGIDWMLKKGGAPTAQFSNSLVGGLSTLFPGFNYAFNAANMAATIQALNSLTKVNVLSTPSLMVLDNKTARLQIGDQVPITTQTATNVVTSQTAIVNTVQMQDTGVILSVTPRINESGRVQLEIEQEVSLASRTTTSGIDSPTIQQRRVKTTVVVNDGEVLALGGMIKNNAGVDSNRLPILGEIPVLGAAFGNTTNEVKKTELLILITPRVVRDPNESRLVTEEFRRRMNVTMPHNTVLSHTIPNLASRFAGQW